ncbi:MAG: PTS sugar transporter subunit IIA [Erysipelotrichaceae bacterium]|nr:PTS sugar transporter subunit IIA [Erysipelotrichaceae bacterium]
MEDLYDRKIALFHVPVKDKNDALKQMADCFMNEGLVKDDFYEKLLAREAAFPTGICLDRCCIALPHCDASPDHVSQVAFMSFDKPVRFTEMGSDGHEIDVSMIFVFTLNHTADQLELMMRFMEAFKDKELMEAFRNVNDYDAYRKLIEKGRLC